MSATSVVAVSDAGETVDSASFVNGVTRMKQLLTTSLGSEPTVTSWAGESGETCNTTNYRWGAVQLVKLTYEGATDRDWFVVFNPPTAADPVSLESDRGLYSGMTIDEARRVLGADGGFGTERNVMVEESGEIDRRNSVDLPVGMVAILDDEGVFLASPVSEPRAFYGC